MRVSEQVLLSRFAVDDFGTGHAGPASTVADRMIARTVSLARCQGARVIAEGIETPAQAARLRDAGAITCRAGTAAPRCPSGCFISG